MNTFTRKRSGVAVGAAPLAVGKLQQHGIWNQHTSRKLLDLIWL